MSFNDENHDGPSPAPESVDDLIRHALAVDVDESQLARLEIFWRQRLLRDLWRRRVITYGSLAAAAAIAVAVTIVVDRRGERVAIMQDQLLQNDLAHVDESAIDNVSVAVSNPDDPIGAPLGRPPTEYERFVFAARTGRVVPTTRPAAVVVQELIFRLTEHPNDDAGQALAETHINHERAEALLLRRLPRATDQEAGAITRLLAECGSHRAVPILLVIGRCEALRDDAMAAMERIVGLERLGGVVKATNDRDLRLAVMRRMLTAGSNAALRGYLSLVAGDVTRNEALSVARQLADPPTDALFTLLEDEDKSIRLSAALVLGTVNGPAVTRSLISRVTTQPAGSNEAWLALLSCRGELADQFFAYATQRPQLLGYVNGARLRWAQMIH